MIELPPAIGGPSAWYGRDIADNVEWIEPLTPAELAEIESATKRLAQPEIDWQALRRQDFPLPKLSGRLAKIRHQVIEGRGFALLRGLPVERWGRRLAAIAFLGLGLHWGSLRSQNRLGHLLGHVKDLGLTSQDPNVRIYQTRERQNYHTDSCDVVALLCLQPAKAGGLSSLVSSVTIFNEMRARTVLIWPACCLSPLRPTGVAKCPPARARSSRYQCLTGIKGCFRPSITAITLNRHGGFPMFRR